MSKKKKRKTREVEILKEEIDKVKKRRTFNPPISSQTGNRVIRLKTIGEKVIGFLGWPITNFREGTSYPIQLESGEVVEIIGNRLLHKQVREGKLCGQKVKIIYQGRDYIHGRGGHYRKVYRVFKYEQKPMLQSQWKTLMAEIQERRERS